MCKGAKKKHILKLAGAALLLAAAVGIGETSAVILREVKLKNEIETLKVDVKIVDGASKGRDVTVGKKVKKVSFQNGDTADVFIRVACAENWESGDTGEKKEILPNRNEENKEIVEKEGFKLPDSGSNHDWEKGPDGWYYYKKILEAGEETEPVLTAVDFSNLTNAEEDGTKYNESDYRLHFQVEAVQASGQLEVSKSAVQEVFGRSISPKKVESNEAMTAEQWAGDDRYEAVIDWTEPEGGY